MPDAARPAIDRVAVCVCTYARPRELARLLSALGTLRMPDPCPRVEVVVVDNDRDGSARDVVARHAIEGRWPVRYVQEAEPGISQARNRAVEAALETSDLVAFIDDDEVPEPDWLAELLGMARRLDADAVGGPVHYRFVEAPPKWAADGGFLPVPRHRDGARVPSLATGNVLVHRRVFEQVRPWFDVRWGRTGGEDTLFFARVRRARFRMVWAARAEVVEWVPPDRATLGWFLRRGFRVGNASARIRMAMRPGIRMRARQGVRAAVGLMSALATLPREASRGRAPGVQRLRLACREAGALAAACGCIFREYRRRPVR